MTRTDISPTTKRLTFEEYRFYQDNTDIQYELYRGQLIPMPTATVLHMEICRFLVHVLGRYVAEHGLDLVVVSGVGVRTEEDSSRIPDVVVCTPTLWERAKGRKGAGVLDFEETPVLAIEVTSENWREDYIRKRAEYALIGIPEYWIADPNKRIFKILDEPENDNGYRSRDFLPGQKIHSTRWAHLDLSVDEILSPPRVEDLINAEVAEKRQLEQQAQTERQRAETERQRAETERQRAETERQRADRLAELLRQQGIDPDLL